MIQKPTFGSMSKIASMVALSLQLIILPATAKEQPPVTVKVSTLKRADISEFQYAQGTIKSVRREYLVFRNQGRVAFIKTSDNGETLREGDQVFGPSQTVKKGELLAELDHRKNNQQLKGARAELDSARIKLKRTKNNFQRGKQLKKKNVIGASKFEEFEAAYQQALAGVRQAEANMDRLEINLDDSQLRAPFDGKIAFINIQEGSYVTPQQFDASNNDTAAHTAPIVLIDPKKFQVEVNLPLFTGRQIKKGQRAFIIDQETLANLQVNGSTSEASIQNKLVPAQVVSVSPAVNPKGRSIRARIQSFEVDKPLLDGDFVTVWIEVAEKQDTLVLPMNALINNGDNNFVYVIDDQNRAHKRQVTLGILGTEGVEVISGLKEGDQVVTQGKARLSDNRQVKVAKLPGKEVSQVNSKGTGNEE
ncbi:MAG: efflux RND transporter periplasmic adaptor subunit [Parashewanella sp.]